MNKLKLKHPNQYLITRGSPTAVLTIFNRKGEGVPFLVDADMVDDLKQFNWSLSRRRDGKYYAYRKVDGRNQYQHAYINQTATHLGLTTDHRSGVTTDNRKENLRTATRLQNGQNQRLHKNSSTGAIGVTYHKRNKNYVSKVTVNGKRIHIGVFDTIAAAALARDIVALRVYGEFANLNYKQLRVRHLDSLELVAA